MDKDSIDIVIPTFRLDEKVLLDIIHLPQPEAFRFHIYIIADNPAASIPASIRALHDAGRIRLTVNPRNLGVAATRNAGIRAGNGKWILFLDDDVYPDQQLLYAYAVAISRHPDALGLAGSTRFPAPFNAVTTALEISGNTYHFKAAAYHDSLIWAPTANIMLNREKLDHELFDPALVTGEDIDFLVRHCLASGERYISVPDALVTHPWWNNGQVQTKRMMSYGKGASQIARKLPVSNYTYIDFTNTSETILLLLLVMPFYTHFAATGIAAVLIAEYLTNWLKGGITGGSWSPVVGFYLMWMKNCREFAFLKESLFTGYWKGFARRIETGFVKPHPSPFRLNKWKIIKMILIGGLMAAMLI